MTELFGRLAPGVDLEQARSELRAVHATMIRDHPDVYSPKADFRIDVVRLRDQITSGARTVLLVLLAASGLIFVIACSNVANLILARTVRRGRRACRARCSRRKHRRPSPHFCLPESLLLCGAGALLGGAERPSDGLPFWLAMPLASRFARSISPSTPACSGSAQFWPSSRQCCWRLSPRLPSADASNGISLSNTSLRITGSTSRRLRVFAITQMRHLSCCWPVPAC